MTDIKKATTKPAAKPSTKPKATTAAKTKKPAKVEMADEEEPEEELDTSPDATLGSAAEAISNEEAQAGVADEEDSEEDEDLVLDNGDGGTPPLSDDQVEDRLLRSIPEDVRAALQAGGSRSVEAIQQESAEVSSFSMPPVMDYIDDPKQPLFVVQIFGSGCLDCNTLLPDAEMEGLDQSCHFSKGAAGEFCPGRYVQLRMVGERQLALRRIERARLKNDPNRLLGAIAALDKLSIEDKKFVLGQIGMM